MIQITASQAEALIGVLQDHIDGEPVEIEKPTLDGTLRVIFNLATVDISTAGTVDCD